MNSVDWGNDKLVMKQQKSVFDVSYPVCTVPNLVHQSDPNYNILNVTNDSLLINSIGLHSMDGRPLYPTNI